MTIAQSKTQIDSIVELLGDEADSLLTFEARGITKDLLHQPGPDHVDDVFGCSDRSAPVLVNLGRLYGTGRLAGTGYMSLLPVDQGMEHSAAA